MAGRTSGAICFSPTAFRSRVARTRPWRLEPRCPRRVYIELFSHVAIDGENALTAAVAGDTADLRAYAATNSGGAALVLFNLNETTSQPVVIDLSAQSSASSVTVETYSKAIYDQSKNNVWAPPTTTSLGAQNLPLALTLDPWSMNVVIIH